MKINEVMKETGLTKKAIYYYENEGLIKPQKDPDNNYRNYSGEEVRILIIINILRRLDVPIKAIGDIIKNSVPMKEVLKEQLVMTNRKINLMIQNKMVMNDLISRDIKERDFSFETLKEFNHEMDKLTTGSEHARKDLERMFPGTLGKTFAIFYRRLMDVPLDTDEKVAAWNDLIRRLDDMKEIDFPDEIQGIVEALYGEMIDDALVGYYANPENQKKIEGYYQLQSFIINNQEMFREIEKYATVIKEDCDIYGSGSLEAYRKN